MVMLWKDWGQEKESQFQIPREGLESSSSQVPTPDLVSWVGSVTCKEGQAKGSGKLGGFPMRSLLLEEATGQLANYCVPD